MKIINLTQHFATPEQLEAGVFESDHKEGIRTFLTFNELPSKNVLDNTASILAHHAKIKGATHAMIGGAPFFMSTLERALVEVGVIPVYAFSVRESVEEVQPDGSVVKQAIFRHQGFVGLG
jgi:hypothetical protein